MSVGPIASVARVRYRPPDHHRGRLGRLRDRLSDDGGAGRRRRDASSDV